jgi:processive 1,2-diacylglycerol beta-glucosyltransferase
MRAHAIDPARIHVTGIPILPAFGERYYRQACAARFGLDPDRRTCLLMGGGAGLGVAALARRLLAIDKALQLVVLAGKNAQALADLKTLAAGEGKGRLFPMGFTSDVPHLMGAADIVVTKPGGLSTSECLAMGVPMIVSAPIPGQEERNADYLLENGAALKAIDDLALEHRMRLLQAAPERLDIMRERARSLGRPHAARDAIRIVFESL